MPIHSDKNMYPGINPHLNSALQQTNGGWPTFHKDHITHIRETLDLLLPENYFSASEDSLQIGTYDLYTNAPLNKPNVLIPDVTIYSQFSKKTEEFPLRGRASSLTLPLIETIDDVKEITSVLIYQMVDSSRAGKPIVRIELLSPSNKPAGSNYKAYRVKRMDAINAGMCLIEIDYLHEQSPILVRMPSYTEHQADAHPYNIIISDPRPEITQGTTNIYAFGVLERLPIIDIPLNNGEFVTLDFSVIYNRTLESSRLFRRILVDYEQEPVNFAAYHEADQLKIREQMTKIAAEYKLNL